LTLRPLFPQRERTPTEYLVEDWMGYRALDKVAVIALMMEAANTSETLVNFYQTTRHYNPEDSHLRTHRRENLKSYVEKFLVFPKFEGRSSSPYLCL
jgi:hypothetical protein